MLLNSNNTDFSTVLTRLVVVKSGLGLESNFAGLGLGLACQGLGLGLGLGHREIESFFESAYSCNAVLLTYLLKY